MLHKDGRMHTMRQYPWQAMVAGSHVGGWLQVSKGALACLQEAWAGRSPQQNPAKSASLPPCLPPTAQAVAHQPRFQPVPHPLHPLHPVHPLHPLHLHHLPAPYLHPPPRPQQLHLVKLPHHLRCLGQLLPAPLGQALLLNRHLDPVRLLRTRLHYIGL